jgi:uncharacterized Zn-binding protein involved in type VI secretion
VFGSFPFLAALLGSCAWLDAASSLAHVGTGLHHAAPDATTAGMMMRHIAFCSLLFTFALAAPATAQQPGKITSGSDFVTVDGKPAARVGDTTTDGKIVEGAKNVYINGKPVAVMGGGTDCGGKTTSGSHGVFVNGKPMARAGDTTSGCK